MCGQTVKRDVKGIFHACQVGSGLKRTEDVCDAEAWDSRDHAHRYKASVICRLSAEMTAFTSSTDSPAYCQKPCSGCIATSPFSSPVVFSPLISSFHHEGITENVYFTVHVFGHLPPSLICKLWRPTDVCILEVSFNYKSPDGEERRGEERKGEED